MTEHKPHYPGNARSREALSPTGARMTRDAAPCGWRANFWVKMKWSRRRPDGRAGTRVGTVVVVVVVVVIVRCR